MINFDIFNANIPKGRILFVHAKIKDIYNHFNGIYTYDDITNKIIESLERYFEPKAILVPSFSYTFAQSGVFHTEYSKSEVGRFSESVRINNSFFRTLNPIFSVSDINGLLKEDKHINHLSATGENSLFHYLQERKHIIINIGLDEIVSTQFHYYEELFNVDYRFKKNFTGLIIGNNYINSVKFEYLVKKLDKNGVWNKKKIKNDLLKEDVLNRFYIYGIECGWMDSEPLLDYISFRMKDNKNYLIN